MLTRIARASHGLDGAPQSVVQQADNKSARLGERHWVRWWFELPNSVSCVHTCDLGRVGGAGKALALIGAAKAVRVNGPEEMMLKFLEAPIQVRP